MGIDRVTFGTKRPAPDELRKRMRTPGPQQTNIWDMQLGVQSYKGIKGRKPLKYYIKRKVSEVKAAVRRGKAVQVCIHYGKWNDIMPKTGDPSFRGGHSFLVQEERRRKDGTVLWLLFDPVDDGRRTAIPQGPRWVPRHKVIRAMVAFGGSRDSIYAGVFAGGQKR